MVTCREYGATDPSQNTQTSSRHANCDGHQVTVSSEEHPLLSKPVAGQKIGSESLHIPSKFSVSRRAVLASACVVLACLCFVAVLLNHGEDDQESLLLQPVKRPPKVSFNVHIGINKQGKKTFDISHLKLIGHHPPPPPPPPPAKKLGTFPYYEGKWLNAVLGKKKAMSKYNGANQKEIAEAADAAQHGHSFRHDPLLKAEADLDTVGVGNLPSELAP